MGDLGTVNVANNFRIRFVTEGNFNIGGGFSSTKLVTNINNSVYEDEIKIYSAKLDFYSFDIGLEATYVFKDGLSLTGKLGFNLASVGADIAMPDGGKFTDDAFGVINLIPLVIKPQILVDFGSSVLGIGFIIHPQNFVEYKYVPPTLFNSDDKGIVLNDDFMTSFAMQLVFHY